MCPWVSKSRIVHPDFGPYQYKLKLFADWLLIFSSVDPEIITSVLFPVQLREIMAHPFIDLF